MSEPLERHFTPQQVAEMWEMSPEKVREIFADEAGVEVLRGGRSQRHAGRGEALDGLAGLQTAQDLGGDAAVAGTEAAADAFAAGQLAVHPDWAAAERVALPFSGVRAIAGVAAVGVKHGEAII